MTSPTEDSGLHCPRCGYNLRALQSDSCPECGEPLLLRVGLVYPKLAAMVTGLIGLSAGVGLNGLLLIYVGFMILRKGYTTVGDFFVAFVLYNAAGVVVEGGLIALWLITWRRTQRRPAPMRWALAAACWVITLANIVWFSFVID